MNWRDLLYFSKGERRALTILLCLITASWITLLITDHQEEPIPKNQLVTRTDTSSISKNSNITSPAKVKPKTIPSERKKNFIRKESNSLPKYTYPHSEKFPEGTIVELNTADTTTLKKVPGIGSTFANRIVKYRNLLGGFYCVGQLQEVYGIDKDRYNAMKSWFSVDVSLICPYYVNKMSLDSLWKCPYLNDRQVRAIRQIRKQKGKLSGWENLQLLEEFTESDKERLIHYLSFD